MINQLRQMSYRLRRGGRKRIGRWSRPLINRWLWHFGYRKYVDHQLRRSAWTRRQQPSRHGLEIAAETLQPLVGEGSFILDLGCGDGYFLDRVGSGVGMDRHFGKVSAAFRSGHPTVVGDIHALPFRDRAFDAVHSSHVLEHALRADRMLDEMHRVLRPGGIALIVVPSTGVASIKHPSTFADEEALRTAVGRCLTVERVWTASTREPEVWTLARR